jgi:hypothetical protein
MRSLVVAASAAFLLGTPQLMAADVDVRSTTTAVHPYHHYLGLGASHVHHVGYVPPAMVFTVEEWEFGGKAFGGVNVFQWLKLEAAYFYLGQARFLEAPAVPATEASHAVAATAIICCLQLHELVNIPWPLRFYNRVGGAYKWIQHRSALGVFDEGGVSYVLGFGWEADITRSLFVRFEYEYISKIISRTNRAVDVQHTPLTLSVGARF